MTDPPERELTEEVKKRLCRTLDQIRMDINLEIIRRLQEPPPDPPPGVSYWLKQGEPNRDTRPSDHRIRHAPTPSKEEPP